MQQASHMNLRQCRRLLTHDQVTNYNRVIKAPTWHSSTQFDEGMSEGTCGIIVSFLNIWTAFQLWHMEEMEKNKTYINKLKQISTD